MEEADPFDLHGSSTPPAFILSQDQTLRKSSAPARGSVTVSLHPLGRPQVPVTLQLLRCAARVECESPRARRGIKTVSGHAREHPTQSAPVCQIGSLSLRQTVKTLLSSGKDPLALQSIARQRPGRAVFPAPAPHSTHLGPPCQVRPLALYAPCAAPRHPQTGTQHGQSSDKYCEGDDTSVRGVCAHLCHTPTPSGPWPEYPGHKKGV